MQRNVEWQTAEFLEHEVIISGCSVVQCNGIQLDAAPCYGYQGYIYLISLCSATTYIDNVALPAFAHHCCSN